MPGPDRTPPEPSRGEVGQVSILIVGFAVVLAMAIAVVVDASAAYLQRQGLDTLADGAALRGADLGASGEETYRYGLPADRLRIDPALARAAVHEYMVDVGAWRTYPGLTYQVDLDTTRGAIGVTVRAPLHLPLTVPGSAHQASIGATGSASVRPAR